MAEVDSSIPLQAQQADVSKPINQAAQLDQQNALSVEQTLKAHYDNLSEREKQRLQSTIVGAAQLKPYLDKGDIEGAHDFLMKRRDALQARMGSGENVDTQETDYALEKLRTGDIQGLQTDVASMLAAGQAYNMVGGNDGTPSSVKEWQYYNSLNDDQKKQWLVNKRAGSTLDLGGSQLRLGPDGKPEASYTKTLAPADQPANANAKAVATAAGAKVGEGQGDAQAKLTAMQAQLPRLNQVVTKLSRLGKTATYTKAGVAANEVARQLSAKVPQGAVDRTAYEATVDNEVLPLLRQTFGAQFTAEEGTRLKVTLGDPNKSPEEKDAVLKSFIEQKMGEIQSLQRQTGQAPAGAAPAAAAAPAAPANGMVKISNGKETYLVSPEDLPSATQEGFQQVQ
jgi:hypothetical protein